MGKRDFACNDHIHLLCAAHVHPDTAGDCKVIERSLDNF